MDTKERDRQSQRRRRQPTATGRSARRTEETAKATNQPEVVYLPGQRFSRNRLLLQLLTVAAVVVALLLGISVFFKVETITVSGNHKYSAWDISQASGIREGENLLTLGIPQAVARIQSALPYVESVRIGIKLPNAVNIEIVESEVVYGVQTANSEWWLVNSGGKVLEKAPEDLAIPFTAIYGVTVKEPVAGEQANALELPGPQIDANGNTVPITVTQSQRLTTALDIANYLERKGIIGKVASINVTDMGDIELWYGTQYQVLLGDDSELFYKIGCLKAAVDEMDPYQTGVLDISFTTWPDEVGFTPFKQGEK